MSFLFLEFRWEEDSPKRGLKLTRGDLASLDTICNEAIVQKHYHIHTLRDSNNVICDRLPFAHASISELGLSINSLTRRIRVNYTGFVQRLKNLVFTNIKENQGYSPTINRRALVSYLNHIFSILQIAMLFSSINRF